MSINTEIRPYQLSAGRGLGDVWWKTGRVSVKTSGAESEGRLSQVEIVDPRGTAPPLHIHHQEDETFFVLAGEVVVFVGDERLTLGVGDYAFVPRGLAHAYLVTSPEARMLVTFSPAGFEQMFLEAGVPCSGDEPPADAVLPAPDEFVRLLAPYGCQIVGPPPGLEDLG
jgi:quercetin dioxygenase-like cupin family protein